MSGPPSTDLLRAKGRVMADAEKIQKLAREAVNKPQAERARALRDIVDLAGDLIFQMRTIYPEYFR